MNVMILMNSKFQIQGRRAPALLLGLALLAGCGRDDVKVYRIAKTDNSGTAAPATPGMPPSGTTPPGDMTAPATADQSASPQLTWTLPAGWVQKPAAEMRLASFSAPGRNGQMVDVSIVPLPGMGGGDLNNVNRWRGQVGLDPIQDAELPTLGEDVTVGDSQTRLYDLAGTAAGADSKSRILAVALHRQDMVWFFKATGDDASVASQKANFITFLNSIQFAPATALPADHPAMDGTLPPMAGAAAPGGPGAPDMSAPAATLPAWTVPAAWQPQPPSAMLLAKFAATENGATAEITVSSFPGDVGGLLANVNRWRRQISLPPVEDAGLAQAVTSVDTAAGPATLADFNGTDAKTGQPARLVGVILPLNGQTWFYKLMGDATVVDHQKADFLKFVQSAKYDSDASATPPATDSTLPPMAGTTAPGGPAAPADLSAPAAALPTWTVPTAWQQQPPSAMLLAKFAATENSATAEITVSSFPGDVGGLLANVNRWCRQISLPPVEDAGLSQAISSVDTAAGPASLADFNGTDAKTGQPARLVGVILPLNGQTWFYKLMGDAAVVEHQKADFLKFVQSVKY